MYDVSPSRLRQATGRGRGAGRGRHTRVEARP
jgi:hypothetical protein